MAPLTITAAGDRRSIAGPPPTKIRDPRAIIRMHRAGRNAKPTLIGINPTESEL